MAVTLGTRGRNLIAWGPADVYIADPLTISAPTNYAENIYPADLTTLLNDFTFMGTLGPDPQLIAESQGQNLISEPGVFWQAHHLWRITAKFVVLETDVTMSNTLIGMVEARARADFIFLRANEVSERVGFLRNVPFLITVEKKNNWREVDKITVEASGQAQSLADAAGQWSIIEDIPS